MSRYFTNCNTDYKKQENNRVVMRGTRTQTKSQWYGRSLICLRSWSNFSSNMKVHCTSRASNKKLKLAKNACKYALKSIKCSYSKRVFNYICNIHHYLCIYAIHKFIFCLYTPCLTFQFYAHVQRKHKQIIQITK